MGMPPDIFPAISGVGSFGRSIFFPKVFPDSFFMALNQIVDTVLHLLAYFTELFCLSILPLSYFSNPFLIF